MAFKLRIMRRIYLFILLLCALVFARADTALAAYYDEHAGDSEADAYIISSKEDLILMRDRVNNGNDPAGKYYKLGTDIDLSSETYWVQIGFGGTYREFAGHFDGQGHTITITFNRNRRGLFQYIKTGGDIFAVKNLHVKGSIKIARTEDYFWAIFGIAYHLNGIIESCDFEGNIEFEASSGIREGIGGIVHYLEAGAIINCTFSGTISAIFASSRVGGIAACVGGTSADNITNNNPTIKNCKVLPGSKISGSWGVGGIAGVIYKGYITGCDTTDLTMNAPSVFGGGETTMGGIIGYMHDSNPRDHVSGNTWPTNYREIGNLPDTEVTPTPDPTDPVDPTPTPTPDPTDPVEPDPTPVTIDPTLDSDDDGLYDVWEINGVDVDGDGSIDIDLKAMGADPNVPDLFIEVDYMYRPESSHTNLFGIRITDKEINLKPSDAAMKIVMEQFARSRPAFPNGINLHIDTGPDSIMDLKTGKKWGSLSRSNTLDYADNVDLGANLERWFQMIDNNFDRARWYVFRHCIVLNDFDNSGRSGVAYKSPGQVFILADGAKDNRKTAGTFMHELGHTLGLHHGGDDDMKYKPNYLSVMNYLYQFSGLLCYSAEDVTNYSEYVLPKIDKRSVNEERGIDPDSMTTGKIIGVKWKLITQKIISWVLGKKDIYSYGDIAGSWIDFNHNDKMDTNTAIDFYIEGPLSLSNIIPASTNDWEHIVFKGGYIGYRGDDSTKTSKAASLADVNVNIPSEFSFDVSDAVEEITLEEAEELGLLHNPDDCEVSSVMPDMLYTGVNNQRVKLTVRNMFDTETTAHLQVTSDLFASVYSSDINFAASADKIIELTVPSSALTAGKHALTYTLTCANEEVKTGTTEIEVQAVKPIILKVGESETLTGTAVGAYALSVEDATIATIEGSTVYAIEAGKTFIILKDLESDRTVCSLPIYVTETGELDPEDVADDTGTTDPTDPTDTTDPDGTTDQTTSRNGSSGGCNSGFGLGALAVIALAAFKKQVK